MRHKLSSIFIGNNASLVEKSVRDLREVEEHGEESRVVHELERLAPRRLHALLLRVLLHRVEPLLEEQQHAVHDAHDEVGRLAQLANGRDVRRLDGLCPDKNYKFIIRKTQRIRLKPLIFC